MPIEGRNINLRSLGLSALGASLLLFSFSAEIHAYDEISKDNSEGAVIPIVEGVIFGGLGATILERNIPVIINRNKERRNNDKM